MEKQRYYFANTGPASQGYGFSSGHVWMWELDCEESWVLKNWTFELQLLNCGVGEDSWGSLGLQGDQVSQSSRKSVLNIHWEDWCLNSNFGHLMQRSDSFEKTLMLGKIEGRRRRGRQKMRWLDSITESINIIFSNLQELLMDRDAWHAAMELQR